MAQQGKSLWMNGLKRIFKKLFRRALYTIIRVVISFEDVCFPSCKSSKEVWDFLEGKYNKDSSNVVEESTYKTKDDESVMHGWHPISSKSTWWVDIEDDKYYSFQETYDLLF